MLYLLTQCVYYDDACINDSFVGRFRGCIPPPLCRRGLKIYSKWPQPARTVTAKLHSKAKAPDGGTHHCVRGSFATYLHFERLHLEIVSHQPPHRSVKCVAFSGHLCHQYFRNSSDLSDLFAGASVFSEVVSCLFRWDLLWYWSSRNGRKSTISAFG